MPISESNAPAISLRRAREHVFHVNLVGKLREARRQEIFEPEKLQFLGGFFAAAQHAQIIELPAHRCLTEILGVAEKSKVTFAQECRNDSGNQQQQEPRREKDDRDRKRDRGDDLLNQASDRLDHSQAVRRLHARPLQPVVKDGILVREQVELGGMLHDLNADVPHVIVGEQANRDNRRRG